MNNLSSLRSELLYQYTEEQNQKNFYKHHNLPMRSLLKTSEGRANSSSIRNGRHIAPIKENKPKEQSVILKPIGRNIFNETARSKVPGPGYYQESPPKRYLSHCYIKKQQQHILSKIAKKIKRKEAINECRGPGLYNPQVAFNFTSKSKSAQQGKMLKGNFLRSIISQQKMENLYLASTLSMKNIPLLQKSAGSQSYDMLKFGFKTSNYSNIPSHRISITQRSNIAKEDTRKVVPGPGFYQWQKYFDAKKYDKAPKPSIQYKFVYGHPS